MELCSIPGHLGGRLNTADEEMSCHSNDSDMKQKPWGFVTSPTVNRSAVWAVTCNRLPRKIANCSLEAYKLGTTSPEITINPDCIQGSWRQFNTLDFMAFSIAPQKIKWVNNLVSFYMQIPWQTAAKHLWHLLFLPNITQNYYIFACQCEIE